MKRKEGLQVLSSRGWLAHVPRAFGGDLLAEARWQHFEKGEQISLAGDENGDIVGIADGFVAFSTSLGRPDSPILHMAPPVLWFGYRSILAGDARVASGIAMSPVACAMISYEHVRALLDARPEWWKHMVMLSMEYGDTVATIASDLTIRDAETRLIAVLLRFGGLREPGARGAEPITVPVNQNVLAEAANLSRNWAGGILRRLAAEGSIETGYSGISIQDPNGLLAKLAERNG
jgi:CRP-like cAMP-binding protein